jgi:N-acylneuraminate cytidylyltransferase/CMP-N,N'-diacetyllegionaminic acid synthase
MLAVIPARGGSKGLPGKNIKPLGGKPLIAYTIEAALAAKSVDRVIVSTDDPQIAQAARQYKVDIPFMRPPELAQDDSRAIDTLIYTIDRLKKEFNQDYQEFVLLYPTVPFRSSEDIDNCVKLFHDKKADSVISYVELAHPLEWVSSINDDGTVRRLEGGDTKLMKNRQELKHYYITNGAIYVFKYALIKEKYTYYSDKTYAYVMPRERSIDIDTMLDFGYAEYLITPKEGKHHE